MGGQRRGLFILGHASIGGESYHTGDEKAVIAILSVISDPYADPREDDAKLAVVDVAALKRLAQPVTLKAIKADAAFADWDLVRNSRLSVMPVPAKLWKKILEMGR
jgi:predicted RNA-binding protein with PUA-like domain